MEKFQWTNSDVKNLVKQILMGKMLVEKFRRTNFSGQSSMKKFQWINFNVKILVAKFRWPNFGGKILA